MDNCKNFFQKIIIVCKYAERKNRHERSKDTEKAVYFFYYIVVLLILMLINMFVMPTIREASIKKVDYNEFMNMTLNKQIKKVEIDDSQITFTDQNGTVYKTAKMDSDWGLTERLYRSELNLQQKFRNRCLH